MFNKKTIKADFIKAIFAGIMIGLGATVFLALKAAGAAILAAFMFGVGLYFVISFNFNLYTGKIGFLPPNLPIILIGNIIGAALMGLLIPISPTAVAIPIVVEMVKAKLSMNLLSVFAMAFCCGMLMYIAVYGSKTISNPVSQMLMIFLSVAVFILCGFEHCIANVVYYAIVHKISLSVALHTLIVVLGNSLGSLFIAKGIRISLENKA